MCLHEIQLSSGLESEPSDRLRLESSLGQAVQLTIVIK